MPYIYTYVYETTQTGLPLMRGLVLEYQNDPNVYDVYGQYLLGKEMLIAPFWRDDNLSREIYLPAGEWIDFWDYTRYQGQRTITYNAGTIDKVPIFVKAGAIIPMASDNQRYVDEKKSPLTVRFYPKGTCSFTLYEDDGKSYDYKKGFYALTKFKCVENKDGITITKSKPKGRYKIPERNHIFRVHKEMDVETVTKCKDALPHFGIKAAFDTATEGWFYDTKRKIIWVKIKGEANKAFSLNFLKTNRP